MKRFGLLLKVLVVLAFIPGNVIAEVASGALQSLEVSLQKMGLRQESRVRSEEEAKKCDRASEAVLDTYVKVDEIDRAILDAISSNQLRKAQTLQAEQARLMVALKESNAKLATADCSLDSDIQSFVTVSDDVLNIDAGRRDSLSAKSKVVRLRPEEGLTARGQVEEANKELTKNAAAIE